MKVKTLLKKLTAADPNADVWLEGNGAWMPLAKMESGIMSDYAEKRGTLHAKGTSVVRLQAKRTR